MRKITAVVNNKGGVGKTHTVFHLAGVFAAQGQRVLTIDLDPQGNLTSLLQNTKPEYTLYDVLVEDIPLRRAVQATAFDKIENVPAHPRLQSIDALLSSEPDAQTRLDDAIKELSEDSDYDQIILDCPPSLALTTINALVAGDQVVIPLEADKFSIEGLDKLSQVINGIQQRSNPELRIAGILLSLFTGRRQIETLYEKRLREQDLPVFTVKIKDSVKYREAITNRKPITHYKPASEQAEAFRQLAKEIENTYARSEVKVQQAG